MNKRSYCLVAIVLLGIGGAARAQGAFVPFVAFEAQRRAQVGFPQLDESALHEAAGVQSGAYDRRRSRYVWRLERDPAPVAFLAEYVGEDGKVLDQHPVIVTGLAAETVVPPEADLLPVVQVVIRRAAAP